MGIAGTKLLIWMLCSCQSQPLTIVDIALPTSNTAVTVSTSRFYAVDPSAILSGRILRDCRYGRTDKIPLVPVLIHLGLNRIDLGKVSIATVSNGRLTEPAATSMKQQLKHIADSNLVVAQSGCHPWSMQENAQELPTPLIAIDSRVPVQTLNRVLDIVHEVGFSDSALWVEGQSSTYSSLTPSVSDLSVIIDSQTVSWSYADDSNEKHHHSTPAPHFANAIRASNVVAQAVHVEMPSRDKTGTLVTTIDAIRASGSPCISITSTNQENTPPIPNPGSVNQEIDAVLINEVSVIPILRGNPRQGARLVTGEICPISL